MIQGFWLQGIILRGQALQPGMLRNQKVNELGRKIPGFAARVECGKKHYFWLSNPVRGSRVFPGRKAKFHAPLDVDNEGYIWLRYEADTASGFGLSDATLGADRILFVGRLGMIHCWGTVRCGTRKGKEKIYRI